jgi:hypothetical protein
MKKVSISCIMSLAFALSAWAQEAQSVSRVFQAGEELRYEVKWSFVRLGTITVLTFRDSTCTLATDFKVVMKVESNPDLGFVHIRDYNESLMDAVTLTSKQFRAHHRNGDECIQIQHSYDEKERTATSSSINTTNGNILERDTLRGVGPFVEGPSLLTFARCVAMKSGKNIVPTMVNGKIYSTIIDFTGQFEDVEIDAFDLPIRTHRYSGCAQWTGGSSAALSGDFTGWISDDDAAIPIRAEMKVILGSVTVELEKWNRPGWMPPTGLRAVNR